MMNATGIETDRHLIQGTPGFFGCTKKLHNTLQGESLDFSDAEKTIYEQVVFENGTRLHLDECDAIIVHDPQPLPLISDFADREMLWLWQCHVDLSSPYAPVWTYLRPFIEQYNAAIFSLPEYGQQLDIDSTSVSSPRQSIHSPRRTGSCPAGIYVNSCATTKFRPIDLW